MYDLVSIVVILFNAVVANGFVAPKLFHFVEPFACKNSKHFSDATTMLQPQKTTNGVELSSLQQLQHHLAEINVRSKPALALTVPGEPVPLSRHRLCRGRVYNPSAQLQKEFANACKQYLPKQPMNGPLEVSLKFYFSRPKTHYRTGKYCNQLKDNLSGLHAGRKDLDNLVKFVLDALNKLAYLDDGQVAVITSGKFYADGGQARTELQITELSHAG